MFGYRLLARLTAFFILLGVVPESLPTPAVNMAFPWGMTLPPPKLKIPGEAILLFDAGGAKLNPPCAGAVNTNGEKEERERGKKLQLNNQVCLSQIVFRT